MKVRAISTRYKKEYDIEEMKEYDVETSLDIPADYFKFVLSNPHDSNGYGLYSELFNPNDQFIIKNDGKTILDGISDDVDEAWDSENGNEIEIIGRDKSLLLLENDAVPATYYNLTVSSLINKLAGPYGFKSNVPASSNKTIKKIVIESGMSEWDVIFEEIKKLDLWLWCSPDGVLYVDKLNYNNPARYIFSNNAAADVGAIMMKSFRKKKRGADIKNEVWIRGHGKKAFIEKYKDEKLSKLGYKRRMITEDGDATSVSKAREVAQKTIKERIRGSFEIEIIIAGKHNIELNEVARVWDINTKTDSNYLIVGVKDVKNSFSGHVKTIRLRPLGEGL